MRAHVLKGSRQKIIEDLQRLDGEIREAIVLMEEPAKSFPVDPTAVTDVQAEDMFAEMKEWEAKDGDGDLDDSREAIYTRQDGE